MPGSNFHQSLIERRNSAFRCFSTLHTYQIDEAIPFLMDNPFSAAFMDMGLGKTVVILTVLQRLFTRGLINKVLIIAPLARRRADMADRTQGVEPYVVVELHVDPRQ